MRKLIFGCGYLGLRVAERWVADGARVSAVTRDPEKASVFQTHGIEPVIADIMAPDTLRNLPQVDSVLFAIGYDRGRGHSIRELYVDGLANVLERLPRSVSRLVYVSSTGVFGQSDDSWVDETSACEPTREGGRACWQAELLLQAASAGPASRGAASGRHLRAGAHSPPQGIAGRLADRGAERGLLELDPRRRCGPCGPRSRRPGSSAQSVLCFGWSSGGSSGLFS